MKTIREQIIERVIAQLENINTAHGYHNDIGVGRVYRQESVFEKGLAPALSVWELSESRERNSYGGTVRQLIIKVEGLVLVNGNKHQAKASNELLGDIEKALIMGDTSLDELIEDIQDIAAEIIQLPLNKSLPYLALDTSTDIAHLPIERKLAGAAIDFEIQYTTEWGDPYMQ
ncbi:MAG: hypothetical protein VSS75_026185 [Candidatus Parabeggiatoa sp.]|nr:hypothetical protein [Candidatus Parabeggiatoa sp.]HID98917.1 hypothetical protein [Thiotrichaceae bacterium]